MNKKITIKKCKTESGIEKGTWKYIKQADRIIVSCPTCERVNIMFNGRPDIRQDGHVIISSFSYSANSCEHIAKNNFYLEDYGDWRQIQELIQEILNPDEIKYEIGFLSEPDTIIVSFEGIEDVYWYHSWSEYLSNRDSELPYKLHF